MNCINCKNPIDENAFSCQWCGRIINPQEKDSFIYENAKIILDNELLVLLEEGHKKQAIQLYIRKTGDTTKVASKYVEKLSFFLKHPLTTEDIWNRKQIVRAEIKRVLISIHILFIFGLGSFILGLDEDDSVLIYCGAFILFIYLILFIFLRKKLKG